MKNNYLNLPGILACLLILTPAGWALAQTPSESQIKKTIDQLSREKTGYEKWVQDKKKCRKQIENDVVNRLDHSELLDEIGRDQSKINAYEADILQDEAYLKKHWAKLTPGQKDWADQLEEEMR